MFNSVLTSRLILTTLAKNRYCNISGKSVLFTVFDLNMPRSNKKSAKTRGAQDTQRRALAKTKTMMLLPPVTIAVVCHDLGSFVTCYQF